MDILRGALGLIALLGLAWLISEDRRHLRLRIVCAALALQIGLALLLLKFPPAAAFFFSLNAAVLALQTATDAGTSFVFGYLGGGPAPFAETEPSASFILAFRAFPLVLVISALASLLLYFGILQRIVGALAFALRHTLGVGGALGLGAAVHIFVGMIEAPLLVRPYLKTMSRGELFALMACGMAGIAGTVMVIYAALLRPVIPDSLGHILIASIISTPAALAVAAIMVPFDQSAGKAARLELVDPPSTAMEAIARGVHDGIGIVANIIFGFQPIMWLIGIPWAETATAATLMGAKTVLNEFVAYIDLSRLPTEALSVRSKLIMTYALCGFANFGSLGIMIGGLTAMAPERKHDIVALGFRSIIAGTLATCMSGAVVGMLI
ncbi:MAG: nucleoside transporter C-terminal domain-containing protein [Methylocella sp.]